MELASSNSSSYYLNYNYSQWLCLHIDFFIGLEPSTSGISCISLSFQLGGSCMGNILKKYYNTSIMLYAMMLNNTYKYLVSIG